MLLSTFPERDIIIATLPESAQINTDLGRLQETIAGVISRSGQCSAFIIDTTGSGELTISQIMTALSAAIVPGSAMELIPQIHELIFVGNSQKAEMVIASISGISRERIHTFASMAETLVYLNLDQE